MMDDVLPHPGYYGAFTRATAPGAIPSDTRVVKVVTEKGDAHPNGSKGVILGSIGPLPDKASQWYGKRAYFIEWDARPKTAIAVVDFKIAVDPDPPCFSCPKCHRVSYNVSDIQYRYCAYCHDYTRSR